MGSTFNAIPYPFSPLYREHEFHASARGTRLSLLAEGKIDPAQSLAAYVEADFLGVATNANYIETNNWAPRLRQAFLSYDNTDRGFHFLAGQAWSLLTQNKVGIIPRQENAPLSIDYFNVVGFDYTRNWQIRFVADFHKTFWFGVSVENPAVITAAGNIPSSVNGLLVNFSNTAGGGFLNGVNVSTDQAPDIIVKDSGRSRLGPLRGVRHSAVLHRQHVLLQLRPHRLRHQHDRPEDLLWHGRGRFRAAAGRSEVSRPASELHVRPRHRSLRVGPIA
jgi:hypothetical protein